MQSIPTRIGKYVPRPSLPMLICIKFFSNSAIRSHLFSVYHSNISAVQFEIGKYTDCVQTIDTALSLLTPPASPNPHLSTRLLLRKTKALFYSKKFEESKQVYEQLKKECESGGIPNLDTDGSLARALSHPTVPDFQLFSICRSSWYAFFLFPLHYSISPKSLNFV